MADADLWVPGGSDLEKTVRGLLGPVGKEVHASAGHVRPNDAEAVSKRWLTELVEGNSRFDWEADGTNSATAEPHRDMPCRVMAGARESDGWWVPALFLLAGRRETSRYWQWATCSAEQEPMIGHEAIWGIEWVTANLLNIAASPSEKQGSRTGKAIRNKMGADRATGWAMALSGEVPYKLRKALGVAVREAAYNAVEWGGGGTICVGPVGGRMQIAVSDNGPGILHTMSEAFDGLSEAEALLRSTLPGVTSSGDSYRGFGLWSVTDTSKRGASVTIESVGGGLIADGGHVTTYSRSSSGSDGVSVRISWDPSS